MKLQTVYIPTGKATYQKNEFTLRNHSVDAEIFEQHCDEVKDVYVLTEFELGLIKNKSFSDGLGFTEK